MKKKLFTGMLLFGAGLLIGSVVITNADSGDKNPGSVEDPIVTKSYVDEMVGAQVKNEMQKQSVTDEEIQQIVNQRIQEYQQSMQKQVDEKLAAAASSKFKIVTVQPGQQLFGGESAEIIVRAGKAEVISSDGQGISDITSGKDIAKGAVIDNNHLLLVPRAGRGVQSEQKTKGKVILMVRGEYTHFHADGTAVKP